MPSDTWRRSTQRYEGHKHDNAYRFNSRNGGINMNAVFATPHSSETAKAIWASAQKAMRASAQSNFDNLPDTGYIRQWQLIPAVVPVSSATLWRKCKAGLFPRPVKLSARVSAWNVGAVRKWLEAQALAGASK